jgi:hypothetical protein
MDESEYWIGKDMGKATSALFEALSRYLPGDTEKTTESLSHDVPCPRSFSNQEPPEYMWEELPFEQIHVANRVVTEP